MKSQILNFKSKSTLPTKGTEYSAGLDLLISNIEDTEFVDTQSKPISLVKYGVSVEIPEGYVGLLVERSSAFKKGVSIINKIGIIDSDYRGELMSYIVKQRHSEIKPGDKISQLLIVPILQVTPALVPELTATDRGDGGFGSTDAA